MLIPYRLASFSRSISHLVLAGNFSFYWLHCTQYNLILRFDTKNFKL